MNSTAYLATGHHLIKLFDQAGITFPTDTSDMLEKVSHLTIMVDHEKVIPVSDLLANLPLVHFRNKHQFFCALNATTLKWKDEGEQ